MKILHLGKFYYPTPGGIETQLRTLVAGINELGVSQRVIVANTKRRTERDIVDGIEVLRLFSLGIIFSTPLCFGWKSAIRREAYDIIHLHAPNPTATLSMALADLPGKIVVSYHADIVKQKYLKHFYDPVFRRVLDRAVRIVTASADVDSYDPILHPFAAKCIPIGYGIDIRRFDDTPEVRARAEKIRAGIRGPIVLFVGRLVYYKGIQVLLRAMRGVDGTLIIVGTGPEEEAAEETGPGPEYSAEGTVCGIYARGRAPLLLSRLGCPLPSVHRQERGIRDRPAGGDGVRKAGGLHRAGDCHQHRQQARHNRVRCVAKRRRRPGRRPQPGPR